MTFLELAQRLASESGTVPGSGQPVTVTGQTGRLGKVVTWTRSAWRDIQNAEAGWRWMRDDFEGETLVNLDAYAGSDFGLTRHADWLVDQREGYGTGVTVQLASDDDDPEGELIWMDWRTFRRHYLRRPMPAADKPIHVSVDPAGRLRLGPTPDGAYTVRGEYRKAPQELAENGDVPEMPARFHELIVDRGLEYVGTDDESMAQLPFWSERARAKMSALRRDQLPRPTLGAGPLA